MFVCSLLFVLAVVSCKKDSEGEDQGPPNSFIHETGMQTDLYPIENNGNIAYINVHGDVVLDLPDYDYQSALYFYNDRAKSSIFIQLSEPVRVDITEPQFEYANEDGTFLGYGIYLPDTEVKRVQYLDASGTVPLTGYEYYDVITEPYVEIITMYGYIYGTIDRNGNKIISPQYADVGRCSKANFIYVKTSWETYFYCDSWGTRVRVEGKEREYKLATNFKTGYAITQNMSDSIFIIIDEDFQVTDTIRGYYNSQMNYDSWTNIGEFCEMLCRIEYCKYDETLQDFIVKYGFANTYGNVMIPVELDFAMDYYNGLALFAKDNQWGYLNTNGDIAIPAQYTDAQPFIENVSSVKEPSGEWKLITRKNVTISPARFKATGITSSGLTAFIPLGSTDNLYGFVNNEGTVIIEPQFYSSSYYRDGGVIEAAFWGELALVELNPEEAAYINKYGEMVWRGKNSTLPPLIAQKKLRRGNKTLPVSPYQYKERLSKRIQAL